ncbi:hypothetical protein OH492_05115 [Vibrio chagasii]|nr:hypothetical protein [Vibrio chagasii]
MKSKRDLTAEQRRSVFVICLMGVLLETVAGFLVNNKRDSDISSSILE